MKKLFMLSVLFLSLAGVTQTVSAQSTTSSDQQQRVKYYYYPNSNVYQNTATSEYWYWDDSNNNWVSAKELPSTITLVKEPSYVVYYNGTDVWKDNAQHIKKYKKTKKGVVKEKS